MTENSVSIEHVFKICGLRDIFTLVEYDREDTYARQLDTYFDVTKPSGERGTSIFSNFAQISLQFLMKEQVVVAAVPENAIVVRRARVCIKTQRRIDCRVP